MLAFDEDARAPLSPKETRLGSFFIRNYTIAKERLQRDVPQPVLLDLLATGLLVVRNCILKLAVYGENQAPSSLHFRR